MLYIALQGTFKQHPFFFYWTTRNLNQILHLKKRADLLLEPGCFIQKEYIQMPNGKK